MGSDLQRQDDREITISVEVGTGAFLPGGKIAMAFKRAWQHRADEYLEAVTAASNVEENEVIEAIADGEGFSDVFATGLQIITSQSDDTYRTTFAHFVAHALNDPAQVDVASFLMEKFGRLRPPHVRVFWEICLLAIQDDTRRQEERRRQEELQRQVERQRQQQHQVERQPNSSSSEISISGNTIFAPGTQYLPGEWLGVALEIHSFSQRIGLPSGVVTSLMRDLYNEGILGHGISAADSSTEFSVSELGKLAYETVGEAGLHQILNSRGNTGSRLNSQ